MEPTTATIIDFKPRCAAYDLGRDAFKTGRKRTDNPYLRPPYAATYCADVTNWYRGFDIEAERFGGGQ